MSIYPSASSDYGVVLEGWQEWNFVLKGDESTPRSCLFVCIFGKWFTLAFESSCKFYCKILTSLLILLIRKWVCEWTDCREILHINVEGYRKGYRVSCIECKRAKPRAKTSLHYVQSVTTQAWHPLVVLNSMAHKNVTKFIVLSFILIFFLFAYIF